jgi:beta-lactamase regulating signal transducer with metallopeptidase domain
VGWIRPLILLPAAVLVGLSPHQLEALLAHELPIFAVTTIS